MVEEDECGRTTRSLPRPGKELIPSNCESHSKELQARKNPVDSSPLHPLTSPVFSSIHSSSSSPSSPPLPSCNIFSVLGTQSLCLSYRELRVEKWSGSSAVRCSRGTLTLLHRDHPLSIFHPNYCSVSDSSLYSSKVDLQLWPSFLN